MLVQQHLVQRNRSVIHWPDVRPHLPQRICTVLVVCDAANQLTAPECSEEIAALVLRAVVRSQRRLDVIRYCAVPTGRGPGRGAHRHAAQGPLLYEFIVTITPERQGLPAMKSGVNQNSRLSISRVLPSRAAPSATSVPAASSAVAGSRSARRRTVR